MVMIFLLVCVYICINMPFDFPFVCVYICINMPFDFPFVCVFTFASTCLVFFVDRLPSLLFICIYRGLLSTSTRWASKAPNEGGLNRGGVQWLGLAVEGGRRMYGPGNPGGCRVYRSVVLKRQYFKCPDSLV